MKAKNLFIYTGHTEDTSCAALCFRHHHGFDSIEEALQHMGECFKLGLELNSEYTYGTSDQCCIDAIKAEHSYCPKCGGLTDRFMIKEAHVKNAILNMVSGTLDNGAPQEVWETLEFNGWSIIRDIYNLANIVIIEDGEILLSRAAFGRVFDGSKENREYFFKTAYSTPENQVRSCINKPPEMRIFTDEEVKICETT